MNGPQHYAAAETYLNSIQQGDDLANVSALAAAAKAHATLALVAATVDAAELGVFEIAATGASGLTAWGKATEVTR